MFLADDQIFFRSVSETIAYELPEQVEATVDEKYAEAAESHQAISLGGNLIPRVQKQIHKKN